MDGQGHLDKGTWGQVHMDIGYMGKGPEQGDIEKRTWARAPGKKAHGRGQGHIGKDS